MTRTASPNLEGSRGPWVSRQRHLHLRTLSCRLLHPSRSPPAISAPWCIEGRVGGGKCSLAPSRELLAPLPAQLPDGSTPLLAVPCPAPLHEGSTPTQPCPAQHHFLIPLDSSPRSREEKQKFLGGPLAGFLAARVRAVGEGTDLKLEADVLCSSHKGAHPG